MARRRGTKIKGELVLSLRDSKGWTQAQLSFHSGISTARLRDIENNRVTIEKNTIAKLGAAFGTKDFHEAQKMLGADNGNAAVDSNIEPYGEQQIAFKIPFIELARVPGSGWAEILSNEDAGQRITHEQIRQGLFRVRVRGDSMAPKYPDGSTVEFRCLRDASGMPDFESLRVGKKYYIQLDDGTGTFKQLEKIEPEKITLRATNGKYRSPLHAEIGRVQKLAVLEGRFEPE